MCHSVIHASIVSYPALRIVGMDALIIERKMNARNWPFFFQKRECARYEK